MDKTTTISAQPKSKAEYEAAIDFYISDMEKMQADIAANRRDFQKLRTETQAILAKLKVA